VARIPSAPRIDEAGTNALLGAGAGLIAGRLAKRVPRVRAVSPVNGPRAPAGGVTRRLSP
jgi:hypothetical protein